MKAIGVIVEYNPFHNGHALHLKKAKELGNPDVVIAVMSGNFVERGEPAMFDKWTRAELAVKGGVDLVIELPYPYVVQSADTFAYGSIDILHKLGAKELYFGSETHNIDNLHKVIETMENDDFHSTMKELMDEGNSYPSAFGKAIKIHADLHFTSNDNLGIQYLQAIKTIGADIEAHTIERVASKYLDETANHESIASATAIRSMSDPIDYVPTFTYDIWNSKKHTWEDYYELVKYKLRSEKDLTKYFLVSEGIENRFLKYLSKPTFQEFIDTVYTRRYPQNRIRRTLTHILNNVTKDDINEFNLLSGVPYIRVLAMNDVGRKYLNSIKKDYPYPIISKANDIVHPMMNLEVRTTEIYDEKLKQREFQPLKYIK